MADYRIEYTIQRCDDGEADFTEIGFGSSGAWSDLDGCVHMIAGAVAHGEWETERGQPEPDEVLRMIQRHRERNEGR